MKKFSADESSLFVKSAQNGDVETVARYIKNGINVNCTSHDQFGNSIYAIHVAAEAGHKNIVEMLINAGAHVNTKTRGLTPLMAAAANGHFEVVEYMLSQNIKVIEILSQSNAGLTAESLARDRRHLQIAELIRKYANGTLKPKPQNTNTLDTPSKKVFEKMEEEIKILRAQVKELEIKNNHWKEIFYDLNNSKNFMKFSLDEHKESPPEYKAGLHHELDASQESEEFDASKPPPPQRTDVRFSPKMRFWEEIMLYSC